MRAAALLIVLVPGTAFADRVILKEGQVIEGRVLSEGAEVVLQIDGGKISFAKNEIRTIEKDEQNALSQLAKRRASLDGGDVKGRVSLARWAKDQKLTAEADVLLAEALQLDPNQTDAHLALGHVKVEGKWLTEDEYQRSKGMVRYGGRWISAEEAAANDANLRERAERRREPVAPVVAETPAPKSDTNWGNDTWIDGAPPLANWAYPAYGYGYQRNYGFTPRAAVNLTVNSGQPISPRRAVAQPGPSSGHRAVAPQVTR